MMEGYLKSQFVRLYHMLLCDQNVNAGELELLYKIGESKGVTRDDLNAILLNPTSEEIPEDIDTKIEYLYALAQMIWADGVVEDIERRTLEDACVKFGFKDENAPQLADLLIEKAKQNLRVSQVITELKAL